MASQTIKITLKKSPIRRPGDQKKTLKGLGYILAGLGFLIVIMFTLLFGRVYCSTICPLGIMQDIITFLRNKFRNQYFSISNPWNKTRYTILLIVSLLLIFGFSLGVNLTDPYSNFGRIGRI